MRLDDSSSRVSRLPTADCPLNREPPVTKWTVVVSLDRPTVRLFSDQAKAETDDLVQAMLAAGLA
jgi:hypothetical protein